MVAPGELADLLQGSYGLVRAKLPRKVQRELGLEPAAPSP